MRRPLLLATALAAIGLIGLFDWMSGVEVGMAIFYVLPILICAQQAGLVGGSIAAVLSAGVWLAGDLELPLSHPAAALWNAGSRLGLFLVVAALAARHERERRRLAEANGELARLWELERHASRTDALTGLHNARSFHEAVEAELVRCERSGGPVCVAYLDLDGFKAINDRHGHAGGDDLLRLVGKILHGAVRRGDVAARVGGDEFAVLLLDVQPERAESLGQQIITRIEEAADQRGLSKLSASIGVVHGTPPAGGVAEILRLADDAMYAAKGAGKARTVLRVAR